MLYFALFRNFVSFVHHYILSTSNSAWHFVKCLVNTGLKNKRPGEAMAVEIERKEQLEKIINRTKLKEAQKCYSKEGVAWRIAPRFWFG